MYDSEYLSTCFVQQVQVEWPDERPEQIKQDIPSSWTFQSQERHNTLTASDINESWYVGLTQTANTLKVTTQQLVRSAILPLARCYRVNRMYEWPQIKGTISTDTMGGRYKSLDGNKYAQVFANESFLSVAYPMESKSSPGQGLIQFIADYGVPHKIICDGSVEQTGKCTEFANIMCKHGIDLHCTEPL